MSKPNILLKRATKGGVYLVVAALAIVLAPVVVTKKDHIIEKGILSSAIVNADAPEGSGGDGADPGCGSTGNCGGSDGSGSNCGSGGGSGGGSTGDAADGAGEGACCSSGCGDGW